MQSSRTRGFRKLFSALPQRVKETAKKNGSHVEVMI